MDRLYSPPERSSFGAKRRAEEAEKERRDATTARGEERGRGPAATLKRNGERMKRWKRKEDIPCPRDLNIERRMNMTRVYRLWRMQNPLSLPLFFRLFFAAWKPSPSNIADDVIFDRRSLRKAAAEKSLVVFEDGISGLPTDGDSFGRFDGFPWKPRAASRTGGLGVTFLARLISMEH